MKKIFLILINIAIAITVNAQTIALHSSTGVQIYKGNTALSDAYVAAQNTDTIYLSGNTFIPPAAFDKQLTVFGAGHYVDSTLATGKTFINGNVVLSENADGFYLEGLDVTGKILFSNNESVNDVVIKRCKVSSSIEVLGDLSNPSQNIALIGNVLLGPVNLSNAHVVLVSNNIIRTGIDVTYGNVINNNIFLGTFSNGYYEIFRGNNNNLANNIFFSYGSYGITTGNFSGNDFRNNLITYSTPTYGTAATVINNYTGVGQGTVFVNQSGIEFNYTHNYHLQTPSIYLGTDGTEVGIYGGFFPYKEGAVPHNPHIQFKNIAATTDVNGDLQIQINVKAEED